jgi:peptide/nickel transport system substrate-binding protein
MKTKLFLSIILITLAAACGSAGIDPNTVVVGIDADPTNLDPRLATDANSSRIIGLVFSGLVRQDEKGLLQPDLARAWELLNPKTYIFHLRRGVRFHDGTPLTAGDVKYTVDSILDPATASPHRSTFEKIERVETPDDYTVRFVLSEPFAPFLLAMTIGIVPRHIALEKGDDFALAPVGTGPFLLAKRVSGETYRLLANGDYFNGAPKLAGVVFRVIPDNTVRFLEMRKGTLNLLINGIELDYIPLVRKNPNLKLETGPGVNYSYIGFNLMDPVLKKREVRQAITHAVDREAILSPLNWAYYGDVPTYDYDPQRSRELLDRAGYPDPDGEGPEMRFTLMFKTSQDELRKRIAAAIKQQLKEVGIGIEIRSYEWGTFYGDIKSGNFQIYTLSWVGVTEPDIYYYIFHSANVPPHGANRGRFISAEVDTLLSEGRKVLDLALRKEYYARVQAILARELPYVSLWHYDNVVVMGRNVHGFVLDPAGDLFSLKDVWIK